MVLDGFTVTVPPSVHAAGTGVFACETCGNQWFDPQGAADCCAEVSRRAE